MESDSLTDGLRETLAIFESEEPRTTPEIAECLDLGRRSTYARLERLVEHGRLETKKVGANARVWWRPTLPRERSHESAAQPADTSHDRTERDRHSDSRLLKSLVETDEEYAMFALDSEGYVETWNAGAERITGYAAEDILGEHVSTFYTDEDVAAGVPADILTEAASRESIENEGWQVRADGSRFWADITMTAIRDEHGQVDGYAKVTRDRTEQREYEKQLETQAELLERQRDEFESELDEVFERISDGFYALDEDLRFLYVNDHAKDALGVDETDIGKNFFDVVVTTDKFERAVYEAYETGEPVVMEDYYDPVDRWFYNALYPSEEGLSIYFREITEQKQREHELERYVGIVDAIGEPVYEVDTEGHIVFVNDAFAEYSGYEESELLGQHVSLGMDDEAIDRVKSRIEELLASGEGETAVLEYEVTSSTGERIPVENHLTLLTDDEGNIQGSAGMLRDISERKERKKRLERSQGLLQHTEQIAGTGGWETNVETGEQRWTQGLFDIHDIDEPGQERVPTAEEDITYVDPEQREAFRRTAQRCMTEAEPYDEEIRITTVEGRKRWIRTIGIPIVEDGEVVMLRGAAKDITERKEREKRLERSQDLLRQTEQIAGTGGWETNVETGERRWTEGLFDIHEFDVDDPDEDYVPAAEEYFSFVMPDHRESFRRTVERSIREGEPYDEEIRIRTNEGNERWIRTIGTPLTEDGEVVTVRGAIRDITERKEREQELQRLNHLFAEAERIGNLGVWEADADGNAEWTDGCREIHDVDDEYEPTVAKGIAFFHPDDRDVVRQALETSHESGEPYDLRLRLTTETGEEKWVRVRGEPSDGGQRVRGFIQDITEQRERERALHNAKTKLEAATRAGGIGTWEWNVPGDRIIMEPWFAEQFGIDPELAREGVPLELFLSVIHEDDRPEVETEVTEALSSCGPFEVECRVWDKNDELRWVTARGRVHCNEDGTPTAFPGAIIDITERKRTERKLEHQREQLTALNSIREVVTDITDAVIDQSTREEIEEAVCERLAASDSYMFAWIGDADSTSQTVNLRAEAGVEGYLDGITISVDPDDPRSEGPTGRALRTGEVQTTHDVTEDTSHEPWRDHVEAYGFRSSATIPIVHEDSVYGVLNVYAARPRAFEGREGDVIAHLGEVIGHAIAATERKRALMSDELVELEFQMPDILDAVERPVEIEETVTLDHAVPVDDEEYLVYGTATPEATETVISLGEVLPHWGPVTIRSDDDASRFEARLTDPPVISTVATLGGYVDSFVIENGNCKMVLHLAPTVEVRQIIDVVKEAYPQAEMVRRQQITRSRDNLRSIHRHLMANLTDRQRAALDAAYHAGFFEWPRAVDGTEVADSLGVSPPTFHQHLRKAEQKVFDALLSSTEDGTG